MDDIRKSFRENEITRVLWKRGLLIAAIVFVCAYSLIAFFLFITTQSGTSEIREKVAERFMSGSAITEEWFRETSKDYLLISTTETGCTKPEISVSESKSGWRVCDGSKQLDFTVSTNWGHILSVSDLILTAVGALILTILIIMSDWRGFVEKGQFYNFDSQILGTKLNDAYASLIKDIEDLESDDFDNLSERLYFLLKQDVWIHWRDRQFYMKVTNEVLKACDNNLLYEEAWKFFMFQKSIEREIFLKRKQRWKYMKSIISLTVSMHFTSASHLLIFLLIFTLLNSAVLWTLVDSNDIVKNFHDTISILSNLGANVEYQSSSGYIFGVYIQLIGIALIGVFVNILANKVKR